MFFRKTFDIYIINQYLFKMNNLTLINTCTKKKLSLYQHLFRKLVNLKCNKMVVLQGNDSETIKAIENFKDINILEQKKKWIWKCLIEGINNVKTDYCCIINADGSMDPKYLDEMLKECTHKDFVFGSRISKTWGKVMMMILLHL